MIYLINIKRSAILMLLLLAVSSCEKFVDVGPPKNETASATVYATDETAEAAMRGLYIQLMQSGVLIGGMNSIPHLTSLSSDELLNGSSSPELVGFYSNELTSMNGLNSELWQKAYAAIFHANSIIEGVARSQAMTETNKKQLEGEAKFIRAYLHFILVNLYGDVPLVTSTNYKVNNIASRTPAVTVYQKIKVDLKDSKNLLSSDYSREGGQKIRPNKWAVTALLARVYLYQGDWLNAAAQASEVLGQSGLYSLMSNLDHVFLKNSSEAIWQLMPTVPSYNTFDGNLFIITSTPATVELSQSFLGIFEVGDSRLSKWIGTYVDVGRTLYYPHKYKVRNGGTPLNEYAMILRLGELYLIRSEARAHLNDIVGAQGDLNAIRSRAGLGPTSSSTTESLLFAIEQERRRELFTEGGHRWFDLKRWNHANTVLAPIKPRWNASDVLYPIPQTEINTNPNLRPQNSGY